VSGKAQAELPELLKKIANLGFEGAVKYQTSDYNGVLRQDLAGQFNSFRDCKIKVLKEFKDKLLS
jgi:hypothetical protein